MRGLILFRNLAEENHSKNRIFIKVHVENQRVGLVFRYLVVQVY